MKFKLMISFVIVIFMLASFGCGDDNSNPTNNTPIDFEDLEVQ